MTLDHLLPRTTHDAYSSTIHLFFSLSFSLERDWG